MPITKTTGYADSNGTVHCSLALAQKAELLMLLKTTDGSGRMPDGPGLDEMAADLIAHKDDLLAILTTGPRTRAKARKAPGTTNPRRAAKRATDQQAKEGFADMRQAANAA